MTITAITMPKWGLTMTEGKVVDWLKPAGASFKAGEELLEIETSKITNVMEAEADGVLARIVACPGTTLPIGALLAVVAPAGTPAAEIDSFVAGLEVEAAEQPTAEEATEPAPQMVAVDGHRLRYLERGRGATPLVLLHGFGGDLNSWMFNQPALAEAHRTLALELPGHGGSSKQVEHGDPDTLAETMVGMLDALGVGRMHLVGHSLGGALAILVATRLPDRVASVSLLAPAGLGAEINAGFLDGFMLARRRPDATAALRLLVHDPALVSRSMVEEVLRYKRLDGVEAALHTIADAWFPAGRQACDLTGVLEALPMPVQIIWGRQDQIIPVAHAEALANRMPVHVLEQAGHLPHMEKAGEVNRLLRAFLAG